MYDLIASWMTNGGPLQELRRDDRPASRPAGATLEPTLTAPERPTRRLTFAFTRRAQTGQSLMSAPCTDGCAAC
ncbi:MAG TPA: hypothetical protein VGQ31_07760 [Candidatus Limnocylindrales bacterium]|jgi:hypothetical protein|nr:hypothetical protein [Candidatus Limnocylindrales bacterium]